MRRVGPCSTARPFRLACAVLCRRHGCRPAGARSRMRRALRAMRMALNMPVAAFEGVSLWLIPGEAGDEDALAVVLKHRDPTLTLPFSELSPWPPSALNTKDLCFCRDGDTTEKQQSRDCHSHAGRLAPSAPKNQGRCL